MDLAVSLQDMLQPGGLIIWELPLGSYTYNNEQVFICDDFWLHCVYMVGNKYLMNLNDTGVNIRINAALAGPMQTDGLMSDALRSEGLIPLVEPFSALGYSYINAPSGLMTTLNVLAGTGEQAPVDWVIVEMRSIDFPDVIIASRPALITRNGDIIDRDGDPYVNFPGIAPGNYRLAIRHRNHLGVLSGGTHYMTQEPWQLIDFSATGGIPLYGGSASTTVVGGKRCLWPGDVNFSGVVNYTGPNNDRDMILQALGGISPTATINGAYHSCDVNMNGIVSYTGPANDRDIILQTIGGVVPTNVRAAQFP